MKEYIERYSSALKTAWWAFVGIIIMLFIAAALSGCTTTKYVEIEKIRTDTTYITKLQKDSVWIHDSVEVKIKGDSVLIERWHTKYKEKIVRDTTYVAKHDTIPQPYPVEKLVEKKLSWFQQTEIWAGRVILTILAGLVLSAILRIKKKFI
jgi:hypothetical protein